MYEYKGLVTNVVDGDTVDVEIDVGFKIITKQRIRLLGIDSPERWEEGFDKATNRLKELVLNKEVVLTTYKADSFGRYLTEIHLKDDTYINKLLLEEGLAVEYKR